MIAERKFGVRNSGTNPGGGSTTHLVAEVYNDTSQMRVRALCDLLTLMFYDITLEVLAVCQAELFAPKVSDLATSS